MHQAYSVHSILKQGVQIESIAAYGNHVILGTRSGQLIMYSVDEVAGVDMRMFNKNFSRKPITQMEVTVEENLLFVLTDSLVQVCDISRIESNFAFMHSAKETKGCTLFAMDVDSQKSTTGEVATFIRVCCAIKRRLVFFFWKKDKLDSLELSIELSDVPRSLCWAGHAVCVGYKDEYVVYDISCKTPKKHDLFLTSSSISRDPCICLIRNNMLGISKDSYLVVVDPSQYKDNKDGSASSFENVRPGGMENKNSLTPLLWSSPLLDLVWDDPYAVGRVNTAIEVRSLVGKDTLVQSIPELQKTRFLVHADKGTIFAAATSELWCLRLVEIPTQRQQLLQQKKFQLAIELTQISDEPAEDRAQTIQQIHMLYAKELFTNKEFSSAMTEFEKAAIDPYDVIRLFPNLVPEPKPGTEDIAVPSSTPPLEDGDLENAYLALIEFLALARQREVVKLRDAKSSSKSLLEIIDTTLLKCYLQTNDSLVAPLLRLNQCHLEESEKTLKKHNKISELIILYQMKGKHKDALKLLREQAAIEGSVLQGRKRTIRYLQELGANHLPLIFEFADWVLQEHPEEGLCIFTDELLDDEEEEQSLPPAKVLDFLISKHKSLVIPYLEHLINERHNTTTLLHNVLLKQYRERVQSLLAQQDSCSEEGEPSDLKTTRAKLYRMLEESNSYSPDRMLEEFPTNMLLEERALILGRLKKHDKVLAIYIQVLGDVAKATEYAEANCNDDENIFHTLIKCILIPPAQPLYEGVALHPDFVQVNRKVALDLLEAYATKIDPFEIFEHLPDDMPMPQLEKYLDKSIRKKLADKHQMQMMCGLLEAEANRLEVALQAQRNISFELNEFSVCPECKKRFPSQSAFVRYPNGQIVHLSCHDRSARAAAQQ
ncbi:vam6/Vps39-like protein [Drosophila kikkawai]|uniref:Vam6/Vps39-like protein n=1 Tax=Drosophila kikkawai TaxID=30033 RepID=A0A6P4JFR0_DROKI|nr:vam6/Vps39-like protein [Drosophila kikkawai]XP_017034401.1 vam6/Vps39-like protein [Drosophila kikkawai]